ncbi:chromosome partitioning protein ParA [Vibrio sp. Isolate25]|uniref:chromosome partitioning protein ParA n=1 Tax=Vibrio TaxID=662 RepID=UPI001EFC4B1B|nr:MULTISPECIES: chromosome partitioning protein ParA [Vibrio]MCG9597659.1 chromosome partitioning protein ParA [Vibrio sp. Isolate25]MCG9678682.1 chromosome partitioning protein ParA [Vibrio sp. Isolate24]USD31394.1 chromosome partitioning protein ParA [Vibrio sp. SCSIO 43186]USD44439.1 chromosome partitioning protein ParA [Vibrio sp. SCSIO 43145]USD68517.1 chromosome partitioning protein ParA [Vibrio sp. SCSIO 43139]
MNNESEVENDDVVVIEERDKRSYLYIVIAGVIGLALGGLAGAVVTADKWQKAYDGLEEKYQSLVEDKKQLVNQVEVKVAKVDDEIAVKLQQAIDEQQQEHEAALAALRSEVSELEKVNLSLEEQLNQQKQKIAEANRENNQLNRQADMQATMFERSRELFQQELKVKQELEALEKEREELEPKIKQLKKDCDLYLAGTSWEAKSDSCDKQDEANSRLSQVNQMIRVHQMDLKQMKALTDELGL